MIQLKPDARIQHSASQRSSFLRKLSSCFGKAPLLLGISLLLPALTLQTACHKKKKNRGLRAAAAGDSSTSDQVLNGLLKVELGGLREANSEVFIDAVTEGALSFSWEQLAGPGTIAFQSPDAEDTGVTADRDGFYWLRLTITGANGQTAFGDVELRWDTQAPELKLTPEVRAFQAITVDGQVSSDATLIEWTQVSGPGQVSFSSPLSGATGLSADLDGTYVLRLTVADKLGNSTSADMNFIWETTVPAVSLGQDIFTNKAVAIDAATTDAVSYTWTQVSGPGSILFGTPDAEDTLVSADADGTYVLRLTIATASGLSASDEINLTWDTTAPSIDLGQDLSIKYRATIDALVDGGNTYAWSLVNGPGKVIFSSPTAEDTALIVDQAGTYEIELSVKDQAGNSAFDRVFISFEYDVRVFAKQVSAGGSHSCAVLDDSSVACWGYNYAQELGYGDENRFGEGIDRYMPPSFPINLGPGKKAIAVTANYAHSCAILQDGSVKCWGQNTAGQLGYGDTVKRGFPAAQPIDLGAGRTASAIATGFSHTCVLLDDSSMKCWGANSSGQLGYGDYSPRLGPPSDPVNLGQGRTALSMSLGAYHSCALLDDESVKCWGANANGQLGYGDKNLRNAPDAAGINAQSSEPVVGLASGAYHSCLVFADGSASCWGRNRGGQLGYGDSVERLAPEAVKLDLGAGRRALSLSAGLSHTCALMDDSSVQCWGSNEEGQLGYGDNVDRPLALQAGIDFANGRVVKSISAGRLHTCAILDDDTLKCWGSNSYGQLGTGKIVESNLQPPLDVVAYGD